MPRLRTLNVATADGPRDILILDRADPELGESVSALERKDPSFPPILVFTNSIDIPEVDDTADQVDITTHADSARGHRVTLDVTGIDNDMTRLIKKMTRNTTA